MSANVDETRLLCRFVEIAVDAKKMKTEESDGCLLAQRILSELQTFDGSLFNSEALINVLEESRDIIFHIAAAVDEIYTNTKTISANKKVAKSSKSNTEAAGGGLCFFENMPQELVVKIFKLGVEFASDAFRVSGINRRCREIALGTPSLWNNLKINTQTSIEAARLSIERSSNLDLRLVISPGRHQIPRDHIRLLREIQHRILHLTIGDNMLRPFLASFQGQLNHLSTIHVSPIQPPDSPFLSTSLSNIGIPELRHYSGCLFSYIPDHPANDWVHNLTSCWLTFNVDTSFYCSFNLPSCERLRLSFKHSGHWLPEEEEEWIVSSSNLPKLQHLLIEIYDYVPASVASDILSTCIPADQLQTFELRLMHTTTEQYYLWHTLTSIAFLNLRSFTVNYDTSHLGVLIPQSITAPLLKEFNVFGASGYVLQKCFEMAKEFSNLQAVTIGRCSCDNKDILKFAQALANPREHIEFKKLGMFGCPLSSSCLFGLRHAFTVNKLAYLRSR